MTKESEFKIWLEDGGAQTPAGRNARAYAIRTIEQKLKDLDTPYPSLAAACQADPFEKLRAPMALRKLNQVGSTVTIVTTPAQALVRVA